MYRRFITLRPTIRNAFWLCFFSILSIELALKEFYNPYIILVKAGDFYLKLCYSILAALIVFFFNIHWPKEEKKIKTFLFVKNKISKLHHHLKGITDNLKIDYSDSLLSLYSEISISINEKCKETAREVPIQDLYLQFSNWIPYLKYKAVNIKDIILEIFLFEDLLSGEVLECLIRVENEINQYDLLDPKIVLAGNNLSQYAPFISLIFREITHAEYSFAQKGNAYELEYYEQTNQRRSYLEGIRTLHINEVKELKAATASFNSSKKQ